MPFFYYYDPYYWMILVPAMLIALLENEFIEKKGWLDRDEFLDMAAIAGFQLGWHGLEFGTEKQIQKKCFQYIITMVSQCDFCRAQFSCDTIENPAP